MKSLLKYIPWEIIICPLSLAVCFAVGIMVFGQLYILTDITFFLLVTAIVLMLGVPALYVFCWAKLIKYSRNSPKVLRRFILEWSIGTAYVFVLIVKHFIAEAEFISWVPIPNSPLGIVWYYFFLPFTPVFPEFVMGLAVPWSWLYIFIGIIFIRICYGMIKKQRENADKPL